MPSFKIWFWCSICTSRQKQNRGNTLVVLPLHRIFDFKRHPLPVLLAETGRRYTRRQKWQLKYRWFCWWWMRHRQTAMPLSQTRKYRPVPSWHRQWSIKSMQVYPTYPKHLISCSQHRCAEIAYPSRRKLCRCMRRNWKNSIKFLENFI